MSVKEFMEKLVLISEQRIIELTEYRELMTTRSNVAYGIFCMIDKNIELNKYLYSLGINYGK